MIDKIILVNDDDSINMARKIALNLGIGVGILSKPIDNNEKFISNQVQILDYKFV